MIESPDLIGRIGTCGELETMFKKLAFAAVGAAFIAATPAAAQGVSETQAATAKVKLWDALSLTAVTSEMYFGALVRSGSFTGTETLSLASDGTTNCASLVNVTCSDTPAAAEFTLNASNGSDVKITLSGAAGVFDPTNNELTLTDGATGVLVATLALTGATADTSTTDTNDYTITGSGVDQTINVHGDLVIDNSTNAPNGVYSASYDVTAEYI